MVGRFAMTAAVWCWPGVLFAQAAVEPPPTVEATPPAEPAAAPAPESDAPTSRLVGEIIVTAQKREENLLDVPVSVQAFSGDALDARGITNPSELGQITPSLTFSETVGFGIVYLRGVGSDVFILGDPSVAYYTDNVYMPFSQGLAQQFGDVERIEVLKGPQGTLFGRNAVGGAINIITKPPQFDSATVSYQSNFADYDTIENRVSVNLPITDTLAMGVSAFYNTAEHWQGGLTAGEKPEDTKTRAARVRVRYKPTDDLDFSVSLLRYLADTGSGGIFQLNQYPSPLAQLLLVQPQRGYDGELDSPIYQTIDNKMIYGDAKWSTPWFDVKGLYSDQYILTGAFYDFDGSPRQIAAFYGPRLYADVQTGEVQVVSNSDSPGADWLQWIAGYYYFESIAGYDTGVRAVVSQVNTIRDALLSLAPDLGNVPILGGLLDNLPNGRAVLYGQLATKSHAFYSQATAHVTDWMSVTLGARYQDETRRVAETGIGVEQADLEPAVRLDPFNGTGLKDTTKSFAPKISLEFRPADDSLVFLTYQEAEKSGTYNVIKVLQPLDRIEPEQTKAWELGAKTRLFDGLMAVSGGVFYYDIKDLQVQYVSVTSGGVLTFQNAPKTEVKGVDVDMTMELFPSVFDALVLTMGGAYVHGRYTDYPGGAGFDETTGLFSTSNDFSGNKVVRTPTWSATGTLSKTWNVPGGALEVAADVYYNDGFYYTAQNSQAAKEGGYTLLGAHLSYLVEAWNLRLTAWGKNLTDEYYSGGLLQVDFGSNVSLGPPITYGLRVNWDFGT
ncbi:MAG TPA: TonB-dependent receptor [Nevskiaceae bacterium]|nr:TonB-dependent receptor [Nevskiaceae bacterium]